MAAQDQTERLRLVRQIIVDLSVLAVIGIVLGFLAPLGTGYMGLGSRIAYWVVLALAGYLFYKPIGAIVLNAAPKLDLPGWSMWVSSVLIASIPMATLVWLVNGLMGQLRAPPVDVALAHYFAVCLVGAVVTLLFNLLPATSTDVVEAGMPTSQASTKPGPVATRFFDRLPPELGTELLALEMEDHYVRAHTALGSDLVLMRLRDAMAELDGIEGMHVHRSWWVARHAVSEVKRDGRNLRLVLENGLEAPVSRANVQPLKEAGWF